MSKITKQRQTGCPVAFGLDTFGDRWTLLVIREMMLNGKETYGDFLEADEGISTNILADRLKHLEAEGILEKTRDLENRRSFRYALTDKGRDLAPIILEIISWSGKYDHRPVARKAIVEKIKADRTSIEAQMRAR